MLSSLPAVQRACHDSQTGPLDASLVVLVGCFSRVSLSAFVKKCAYVTPSSDPGLCRI